MKNKKKPAKPPFAGLIALLILSVAAAPFAMYGLNRLAERTEPTADYVEPPTKPRPHHTHTKDAAETAKLNRLMLEQHGGQ